jgi:hypothetical protein
VHVCDLEVYVVAEREHGVAQRGSSFDHDLHERGVGGGERARADARADEDHIMVLRSYA